LAALKNLNIALGDADPIKYNSNSQD